MTIRSFLIRACLVFLLAFSMLVFGVAIHKYKFFPYFPIKNLSEKIMKRLRPVKVDAQQALMQQYTRDVGRFFWDKDVDTALLPLRVKGVRLAESISFPVAAGSVTTVDDTLIVLDRLGNIYSCNSDGGGIKKLPFPELPNNVAEYLAQPNPGIISGKTFRAYHIRYLEASKSFAVSHECFDLQSRKTQLAVSVIGIDPKLIRPTGAWKTIFLADLEPTWSNEEGAGGLASAGPDKLYVSIGDYFIPSPKVAQDPNSSFGKVKEISLDGKEVKTISSGHRAPEGLFIMNNGDIVETEHGPAGGDELNLIREGSNYGWPVVTLGTDYGSYGWHEEKSVGTHGGFTAPLFAWVPSIGVSGLIQVEGFNPRWDGDLLVASLKARTLFRLRMDHGRVVYAEPIYIGQRIRDLLQLKNGTIVLWTDDTRLLFLSVDQQKLTGNRRILTPIGETMRRMCMYCHHFGPTTPVDTAPSLSHVFGRRIASDNFQYGSAMKSKEGAWTEKRLSEFLSNPGKFANGTGMPQLDLSPEELNEVLQDLEHNVDATPD